MKLEIISKYPENTPRKTPILFVHGAFGGAWCWEEYFLPYFARRGYVSHALSFRGHGRSEGAGSLNLSGIADYVADLVQAVRDLGTSPILVGHSMGGLIVQKHLESFERPAAVLLASTPHTGLLYAAMKMFWHSPMHYQKLCLINMLPKNMWEYVTSFQEMRDIFFSKEISPDMIKKYLSCFQQESHKAMWEMTWFKFLPQPCNVKTPLLVLGGEDDMIIPPDFARSTARAYNTRAHIFPNMGHAMMLDKDWQVVADHILEWLNKLGI